MTSSDRTAIDERSEVAGIDPLPPALSSMWRLCKLGYRREPRLMLVAFVLSQLAALPDALLALWLALLGKGVIEKRPGYVMTAAIGLGLSAAATWFLRTVGTRVQRRFRDKVTIALESHVARLQATVATIAHQERPDYLDLLDMLRNQVFVLDHMYMSVFATCSWILRLVVTVALLMSVHPALILLAVFALPTAFTSIWRPRIERAIQERAAQSNRLARHLFTVATTPAPAKEVRMAGIGHSLVTDRRLAWEHGYRPIAAVRWRSAMWHTLAWAIFAAAYVGAVVFVSSVLRAPASSVLLVLAAGARLSAYIGATVGEIGFLTGFWMYGAIRLAWLEDYAAAVAAAADQPVPDRLTKGIRFDHGVLPGGPQEPRGPELLPGHVHSLSRKVASRSAASSSTCSCLQNAKRSRLRVRSAPSAWQKTGTGIAATPTRAGSLRASSTESVIPSGEVSTLTK